MMIDLIISYTVYSVLEWLCEAAVVFHSDDTARLLLLFEEVLQNNKGEDRQHHHHVGRWQILLNLTRQKPNSIQPAGETVEYSLQ